MIQKIIGFLLLVSLSSCFNLKLQKQAEQGNIHITKDLAFQIYRDNFFKKGQETDDKFQVFYNNLKRIAELNSFKNITWTAGINQNTFLTDEEWQQRISITMGQNCSATAKQFQNNQYLQNSSQKFVINDKLPEFYDWRDYGVVSPVKDQQDCGSCWSFSSTGAIESHWALKTGVAPPLLSEQQLLDCAGDFDNHGCNGGLPSHAFEYLKYNGGIASENQYPYRATESFKCHFVNTQAAAKVKGGSFNITYLDENQLQEHLYEHGPVSIAYTVVYDFKHYVGGIYNNPSCPSKPENVNHAVLAVGYGIQDNIRYWILKNSWGPYFGENGYFRMVMGENMCGIADCASYPLLEEQQQQ